MRCTKEDDCWHGHIPRRQDGGRGTIGSVPIVSTTRHAIASSPRGWMRKKRRRQFPAAAVLATNHQPSLKLPPPRLALWRTSQPRERREMTNTTTGCQQPRSYQQERETERGKSPRTPKGERVLEKEASSPRVRARAEREILPPVIDDEMAKTYGDVLAQRRRGDGERGRGVPRRRPRTLPRTQRTERNGNSLMQEGWQA